MRIKCDNRIKYLVDFWLIIAFKHTHLFSYMLKSQENEVTESKKAYTSKDRRMGKEKTINKKCYQSFGESKLDGGRADI